MTPAGLRAPTAPDLPATHQPEALIKKARCRRPPRLCLIIRPKQFFEIRYLKSIVPLFKISAASRTLLFVHVELSRQRPARWTSRWPPAEPYTISFPNPLERIRIHQRVFCSLILKITLLSFHNYVRTVCLFPLSLISVHFSLELWSYWF